jgi:hypothetical protein
MFLQGSAGTGKPFTIRVLITYLEAIGKKSLICATTGIAAVQYRGGTTLHSLFRLGIDEESNGSFLSHIGRDTPYAQHLLRADLIIIDEVSMLTPWIANRASMTLRSISIEDQMEFGGKMILFVGDLLQLPPVVPNFSMPVVYRLITRLPYWSTIRKFQLQEPMRATDREWTSFLRAIATGQTQNIHQDWRVLSQRFGITLTSDIDVAQSFFCDNLRPGDPFPLDRQWICATNKLVNEMNSRLHDWRSQEAPLLGVVFASTELITPLANCPGLSESQQIDFIQRIDIPDLPPNELHILEGDPFMLLRNIDTRSGLAKGRRCRARQIRNRTVVLEFDDGEKVLTRIPMEKNSNGMTFVRWQLPLRSVFAGTVHRSQGMTLDRAVIDCRTKFWEHGQLYVALSRVKRPADLCIVLPPDEDHFLIEPSVDLDVVRILDTFTSGMTPSIGPPLPMDEVNPGLPPIDCPRGHVSDGLPCFGDDSHDSDDETDWLQHLDDDPEEIADPPPMEIARNNARISSLLEDQVLLGINCLGPERAQIQLTQTSVSLARVLNCAIGSSSVKLLTSMSSSGIPSKQILLQSLAQTKTLFGRYLILYRASLRMLTRISKCETLMIEDVIGPGLFNRSHLCYISAFVQVLFHILPLRPIIRYWPNQDHTMSHLRAVFVEMCENRVTDPGSLSDVCEPNVRITKDCSEFALQIVDAMLCSSSGRLKASIENLICYQITTRVWGDSLNDLT